MAFLAKKAESDAEFRRTKSADDTTLAANVYSYDVANESATSSCPTTTTVVTTCLHAVPLATNSASYLLK